MHSQGLQHDMNETDSLGILRSVPKTVTLTTDPIGKKNIIFYAAREHH